MSVAKRLLARLEEQSDWLSPLLVKEVRQVVRGREFLFSFIGCLVVGLIVAFVGATEALAGSSTSGRWTFAALMGCLAFLGLAVVPLGAFSTLRNERMEQTLELITLTALSPRRIVIGKLLSQSVKLATLFAAIAPFLAMSFLLGGIDLVTILIALVALFMGSVWAGALCLCLSAMFKSRAMSGLIFGAVGLLVIFLLFAGVNVFMVVSRGRAVPSVFGLGPTGSAMFKEFAILTTFWLTSLVNLVLLAEDRLSLATEDTVTPLRIGLFVQFLLMLLWALLFYNSTYRGDVPETIGVIGSIYLAVVATFVVTEEMSVPRRVLQRMRTAAPWRWLLIMFGPGAGRGAAYILAQMLMLLSTVAVFQPPGDVQRVFFAACGYICFFTGVPALAFWRIAPTRVTPVKLRVAVLVTFAASLVVPDIIHYAIFRPEILDISYSVRHLLNPVMTLANWDVVERSGPGFTAIPFAIGLVGVLAYVQLFRLGIQATGDTEPIDPRPVPVAGEAGRGGVLY